ncbi:hypothetical protein [Mesorhizobium sp. M0243]|uniref:hypothetical protein n=1 Tax=Mesorhizobium sp. M0243 TaxID=2956925 RepID=UPI00333986D5
MSDRVVFFDRSYLSTFAYLLSMSTRPWGDFTALYEMMRIPRIRFTFVYLSEDPRQSYERAMAEGRSLVGQWAHLDALQRMAEAYECLLEDAQRRFKHARVMKFSASEYFYESGSVEARIASMV